MTKGWHIFHIGLLRLRYAVGFFVAWLLALGLAIYLNGEAGSFDNPASLVILGITLLATGYWARTLSNNDQVWSRYVRDSLNRSNYLSSLRASSLLLYVSAIFLLTLGAIRVSGGA